MPVAAPAIRWPELLSEQGPDEDPSILLAAEAAISGVTFRVMLLRMHKGLRAPDYKSTVPHRAYDQALAGMLDDVEDLVRSSSPARIALNGFEYLLWMVPKATDDA